ncbi:unnamed protein product [Choristocarpus tenellus]
MKTELAKLVETRVWDEVKRPSDRCVVQTKWVFKRKVNSEGEVIGYKARLVVMGNRQIPGLDYIEKFAPTPSTSTL